MVKKFILVAIICFTSLCNAKNICIKKHIPPQPNIWLVNENQSFIFDIGVTVVRQNHINISIPSGFYRFKMHDGGYSNFVGFPSGKIASGSTLVFIAQGNYNIHYSYGNYNFVAVSPRMLLTDRNSFNLSLNGSDYTANNIHIEGNFGSSSGYFVMFDANPTTNFSSSSFPSGQGVLNSPNRFYIPDGTYNVSVSVVNFYVFNKAVLGTNLFDKKPQIIFYPSPSTTKITFNKNVKFVSIFTLENKLVNTKFENSEIDISSFSNGVYLVRFTDQDGNIFIDKLIKN